MGMRNGAKLLQGRYHQLLRAVHISKISSVPTRFKNKYVGLAAVTALTAGFGGLVVALSSDNGATGAALGLQTNNQPDPLVFSNPAGNSSSASVDSSNSSNSFSSTTTVEVNGESIDVPQNGGFHKVIKNVTGTTTIDISNTGNTNQVNVSSSSQGSASNQLNTDVKVNVTGGSAH